MTYLRELVVERRALISVVLAGSVAIAVNSYFNSIFAPAIVEEFGWSRSDFALTSVTSLLGILSFPLVGRLADRFGARPVALVGATTIPSCYVAYTFMTGEIWQFFAITSVLITVGGAASTAAYGRVIAVRIFRARGFALAMLMTGPAIVGALGAPILNELLYGFGWRTAYRALAAFVFCVGVSGVLLIPNDRKPSGDATPLKASAAYGRVLRSPAFYILVVGMLLCNLGSVLSGIQLKPMLLENGIPGSTAGFLISVYAIGVILGRFFFGICLDRYPTPIVAFVGMGLPALGLALLATDLDTPSVVGVSVLLLGLSQGAEGDVASFACARYLGPDLFGTAYGPIAGVIVGAGALGAIVLSYMLTVEDSFRDFIVFSAAATVAGAALFLGLWRVRPAERVLPIATSASPEPDESAVARP